MKTKRTSIPIFSIMILFLLLFGCSRSETPETEFDIVVANGKIMNPETGTELVADVGIRDGRIDVIA